MKVHRILLVIFLFNLIFLISPLASFNDTLGCEDECVTLNFFPIDLDLLYCQDNSTRLNELLNEIGNNSGVVPIYPWGGFFTSLHIEGNDKWNFNTYRQLEIYSSHDGELVSFTERESSTQMVVQDNEVITDTNLRIDIGDDCSLIYGHLTILKSVCDEIKSTGKYSFTGYEHIGYLVDTGADFFGLDFNYIKDTISICPYEALNPTLQTKITDLYDLQYQRMVLGGLYPQSNLCNDLNIYVDDTIWGPWIYKTGPFDEYVTDDSQSHLADFGFGTQTYCHRNFTNSETYWKDARNPNDNLTDDIIGIYEDYFYTEAIPGYNRTGRSHVKLIEGDHSQGIMELCIFAASDWAITNTSIYAKFEILIDSIKYPQLL